MAANRSNVLGEAAKALKKKGSGQGRPPFIHKHRPTQRLLRLEAIELDPDQPRKNVGDISDLVTSITDHGLIEPLVVRPIGSNRYAVIAGERRYQACLQAGLDTVPCMIRDPSKQHTLEIQLIENLHRKDLDPFEEAGGYHVLKVEHSYKDGDIAKKMAKSRTHINQMLSLMKIPDEVREQCQSSDIPLSRDTLYLIAKQPTVKKMLTVLETARSGIPREQLRSKARKGEPRDGATPKKPKWAYSDDDLHGTVIVQSHNKTLSVDRQIELLQRALKKRRRG